MKYKKGLIFICLIICLFSIASVCASDVNETVVASGGQSYDLITVDDNNEIVTLNNQNKDNVSVDENVENVATTDENELSANPGTFTDLANEIKNSNGALYLNRSYIYTSSEDSSYVNGISINKKITIYGNGFTINGNYKSSAFLMTYDNIIISNILFINCKAHNSDGYGNALGGAIFCKNAKNTIFNCTFINCSSTYGGAICSYGSNTLINNCNFEDCFGEMGGAICISADECIISDTNFKNCKFSWYLTTPDYYSSSLKGGAIYLSGSKENINNCTFEHCYISDSKCESRGGAIYWEDKGYGQLYSCNFTDCFVSINSQKAICGGAIYWEISNGKMHDCYFNKCYALNNYSYSYAYGGAVFYTKSYASVDNTNFKNCFSSGEGGAISSGSIYLNVSSCIFEGNSAKKGGAIQHYVSTTSNSNINKCIFINNNADSAAAIFADSTDLTVKYSIFLNNGNILNTINNKLSNKVDWNWWGTTNENFTTSPNVGATLNNWFFLQVVYDESSAFISLNNLYKTDGSIIFDKNYNLPDINFTLDSNNIILTKNNVIVKNNTEYISFKYLHGDAYLRMIYKSFNYVKELNLKTFYIDCLNTTEYGNYIMCQAYYLSDNYPLTNEKIKVLSSDNFSYNTTTNETGGFSIPLDNFTCDKFIFQFFVSGFENYIKKEIRIVPANTQIEVSGARDINVNQSINLKIILNQNKTFVKKGNLSVYVNNRLNKTFIINNHSNEFNLSLTNLYAGKYNVTVIFNDINQNYKDSSFNFTFNVLKYNSSVKIVSYNKINNEPTDVIVDYFIDNKTNVSYEIKDYAGKIVRNNTLNNDTLIIYNLEIGNYILTIFNHENEFYYGNNNSINLTIKKSLKNEDINIDGELRTIKLPDDAEGIITLEISMKSYNFTVVKGVCNVELPELANGDYDYILTYSGDDKYSSFIKNGSLNINKQTTSKTQDSSEDLKTATKPNSRTTSSKPVAKTTIALKTVKVKKSVKKLVLQATLKQGKNPLKNKKIIFKFNGKKYTAKTNKKGIAKFTIKKNILKKLKVGKKVKYQASYGKITVKKSVKIKK